MVRPVLEIRVLIVSALYVQLLFSCVGSRGLGLAALVSGGGRVSQWSAVVAVWSFQVERGGRRRCAAVEGGSFSVFFCTHTNIDVHTYSKYIVLLTLYSKLMMAS